MRKLTYAEIVFKKEIEPHLVRNKEKSHKRTSKATFYDSQEAMKGRYSMASMTLIVLVRAGIPYNEARKIIGR